ncbi:caspase family protein [Leifsonia sp. P73]|uniref:caspase family protein n=1 Tax=Leifsonia sp. P73 TaxID=3423959 RepID=UPI003DA55FE2
MVWSESRYALTISVSNVESAEDRGPEKRYRPLSYADARSAELAATLREFAYSVKPKQSPTGQAIDDALLEIMNLPAGARIVHVIAHGTSSQNDLHLVGSDGRHSSPLNTWTREPSEIMLIEDPLQSVPTLFIVDSCSAGTAIIEQLIHRAVDGITRRWVVGAASDGAASYDGRLTQAVRLVGQRIGAGALDIAPDFPHIPYMQFLRELRVEIEALSTTGPKQILRVTPVERDDPGSFPFFSNPAFVEMAGKNAPPELGSFLESLAFDAQHWRTRAAGLAANEGDEYDDRGAFAGRKPELVKLASFVRGDLDEHLLIVTGAPGSGKSALLALLVCNAHAALATSTRGLWLAQSDLLPGVISPFAAVHARQLVMAEVVDALRDQLYLPASNGPEELISQIEQMPEPPVIVIDALDEASVAASPNTAGSELLDGLIRPLIDSVRPDGSPSVRLIIGTRRWAAGLPVVEQFAQSGTTVDLDDVPVDRLRVELQDYAVLRLSASSNDWGSKGKLAVAQALSERLTAQVDRSARNKVDRHFLAASLFLSAIAGDDSLGIDAATLRARQAPTLLSELLEIELARHTDADSLRRLLRVLALIKGSGAPLAIVAKLFEIASGESVGISETHTRDLLTGPLSFYLRTSSDADGSVLYRLFHQGLVDHLRDLSLFDLRTFFTLLGGDHPNWERQRPYILRHIVEHAVDIDNREHLERTSVVSWLWEQPGFMLSCNPSIARGFAPPIIATGFANWELFASTKFGPDATRTERARQLAIQAVRWEDQALGEHMKASTRDVMLWPAWGTTRIYPHARSDERHPVTLMPFTFLHGLGVTFRGYTREGPPRIAGTFSGLVWAGEDADKFDHPLWDHGASVTAVAVSSDGTWFASGSFHGQVVSQTEKLPSTHAMLELLTAPNVLHVDNSGGVVVGLNNGVVQVHDLVINEEPGTPSELTKVSELVLKDRGRVTALERFRDGDILVAFEDRTLIRWSPSLAQTIELSPSQSPVTSIALSRDERLIVCGYSDGSLRRWDLTNEIQIGTPIFANQFAILAVRILSDGVTIEAFGESGSSSRWDLFKGTPAGSEARTSIGTLRSVTSSANEQNVLAGGRQGLQTFESINGRQKTLGLLAEHPITNFVVDGVVQDPDDETPDLDGDRLFKPWFERRREYEEDRVVDSLQPRLLPGAFRVANRRLSWLAQRKYRADVSAVADSASGMIIAEFDCKLSGWERVQRNGQDAWAPRWMSYTDERVRQLVSVGKTVAGLLDDGAISMWNVETGEREAEPAALRYANPSRTILAPIYNGLMIGHGGGEVVEWVMGSKQVSVFAASQSGAVTALNDATSCVLLGTELGTVTAIQRDGELKWQTQLESRVVGVFETSIIRAGSSQPLVIAVDANGAVDLLDAGTGERVVDSFRTTGTCTAVAFNRLTRVVTLMNDQDLLALRLIDE